MAKGMMQPASWRSTTLIVSESALIFGVVAASGYMRLGEPPLSLGLASVWPKALLITSICQLCMYYGDLYDNRHALGDRGELIIRTLQALGATLLILAGVYTIFPALIIARGVLAPAAALAVAGVIAWRLTFLWVTRQVGPRERLLLVGSSTAGLALARELTERSQLGVEIVGLVDAQAPEYDAASLCVPDRSIEWSSAWPTRAASCRCSRCSR
jgi:FlaA1/EpsC-like NDP-sugar epimerase